MSEHTSSTMQAVADSVVRQPDVPELNETHLLLLPAIARVGEFADLPRDWDGDDAAPITAQAMASAVNLIMRAASAPRAAGDLTPRLAIPTTSSPIPDGGIQVEWSGKTDRIDVQISPNGTLGYLVKWGRGRETRYAEANDGTKKQIIKIIHQVVWSASDSSRG